MWPGAENRLKEQREALDAGKLSSEDSVLQAQERDQAWNQSGPWTKWSLASRKEHGLAHTLVSAVGVSRELRVSRALPMSSAPSSIPSQ